MSGSGPGKLLRFVGLDRQRVAGGRVTGDMDADCSSAGPTWLNLKLSVALAVATVALVALGTEYLRLRQEHKALEAKHKALRNESHSASNAKHKAEQQRFKADACAQVRGLQLELDKAKLQARLDVLAQVLQQ